MLRKSLPRSGYTILCDVTLRTDSGANRIDCLVVSHFGLFVIGIQERSGWIAGDERVDRWTQSTEDSRVEFRNPLRENRSHIVALQSLLGLHSSRFHSLVVFTGKAEFIKSLPANVMRTDRLLPYIEVTGTECLGTEAVQRIIQVIESSRQQPAATAGPPPARPQSRPDVARPALPRLPHGFTARLAAKALAGVGAIALLLVVGDALMQGLTEMTATGGGRLPAFPEPRTPENLQCVYAGDTDSCACYDPEGARVGLDFEQCKVRAERSAGR